MHDYLAAACRRSAVLLGEGVIIDMWGPPWFSTSPRPERQAERRWSHDPDQRRMLGSGEIFRLLPMPNGLGSDRHASETDNLSFHPVMATWHPDYTAEHLGYSRSAPLPRICPP